MKLGKNKRYFDTYFGVRVTFTFLFLYHLRHVALFFSQIQVQLATGMTVMLILSKYQLLCKKKPKKKQNKYRCESNCSRQSMNIPLITLCEVAENVEPRHVNRDDLTRSRTKFRSPRITINQKVDRGSCLLRLKVIYGHAKIV